MYLAGQAIFIFAITTIKLSILFFYLRIFPGRRFKIIVICIGALQIAWCISIFGALVFACEYGGVETRYRPTYPFRQVLQ
jgi:hypothetical protein